MFSRRICIMMFFVFIMFFSLGNSSLYAFSFGPPDGRTGSPADGGLTCWDGCHNSFPLNSGFAQFSISAPDTYTPGGVVDITVSFVNNNPAKNGFELSALDANNNHVGEFSVVDMFTQTGDYYGLYKTYACRNWKF